MKLKIDHVAVAGSRLEPLQSAFADVGLATDYGGPHSNGVTHMSLLGFDDGSYIELISSLRSDRVSPWWHEHIVGDAGPCAWALETDDVAVEAQRARALGITVAGPTHVFRDRPDGTRVEWDQAILGDHGMGALLPFVLKDRTPRHYRVKPSVSVADTELKAVGLVVLGIADLDRASKLFQHLYDLPPPTVCESSSFAATLAHFENQPFALATPPAPQGWLHNRLMQFGDSPCACLIGTTDFAASKKRFPLGKVETWFDRQVAWFGAAAFDRLKIGLIEL